MKKLNLTLPGCVLGAVLGAVLMAGCAGGADQSAKAEAAQYRCDNNMTFIVKFGSDSATIDSNRGYEVLFRAAGGVPTPATPNPAVYSNPRLRADFGLGATGKEAILRYPLQPLVVRCARD